MLDVHGDVRGVNDVAVFKDHVGDLRRARLGTDLESPAPVVPDHATAGPHVADRTIVEGAAPGLQPLEHQAVVERSHEAVADRDALAVTQIDAIGVVPPEADELDVRDLGVGASQQGAAPLVWVAHHHALNPDVSAVGQANGSASLAAFEVTTINDPAPEHPDVGGPVRLDAAMNDRATRDVDRLSTLERDLAGPMHAGAEVAHSGLALRRRIALWGGGEQVQGVVAAIDLHHHWTRPRISNTIRFPSTVGAIPREAGLTTTDRTGGRERISTRTGPSMSQ